MRGMNASSRTARVLGVGIALLALLGVVAYASRSGVGHTSPSATPSSAWVSWVMSVFLIVFVLAIPFAVWAYMQQTQERLTASRRSFASRIIRNVAVVVVASLIALLWTYLKNRGHGSLLQLPRFHFARPGPRVDRHGHIVPQPEPTFQWPVLWVALAVLAAVAAAYVRARRRLPRLEPLRPLAPDDLAGDVASTIGDALDDLEAEPDARRAVIAAYARMEGVLARSGAERRVSETPLEYVQRVLLELTAQTAAVTRLTDLFEEAKFSRHRIDASMKQDAITALRTIRDDLVGVAA
jgi:HAMP domain-containing protein